MNDQADQMAPEASPGVMSKKTGVRRVNNMPMYILAAALGAFLLVMMLVAADRAVKQNTPTQGPAENVSNTSMFAEEIVGNKEGGIVEPASMPKSPEQATSPEPAPVLIAQPDNLDAPPGDGDLSLPAHDEEADRIRMAKLHMFQEAVRAKTSVQIDAPRSSGSPPSDPTGTPQTRDEMLARLAAMRQQAATQQSTDPTAAYQQRLAQLRASGVGQPAADGGGAPHLLQNSGGSRNSYTQFGQSVEGDDRWRLDSQPEAPRSPYELRAGFVVPATLISGINSDLPGQIMAQVAQNVYDTATGKHLLIPQGSRLVGSYSSDVAYGQRRVLVAWQRIVFPDGKAMDIDTMPGADSAGYAGFNDQVNNHYLRVFGSAFLMSGVVAAVSLSQNNGNSPDNQQRASDALSEALGQVLGNTIAQMISKNLNIAPTLEIRPGYRFNVIVTKDMTFSKPYQSFDY